MLISDWSSDVFSSDLAVRARFLPHDRFPDLLGPHRRQGRHGDPVPRAGRSARPEHAGQAHLHEPFLVLATAAVASGSRGASLRDRKSVVTGKSVAVSIVIGGGISIEKYKS